MIRCASVDVLASLPDIERAADAVFRDESMIAIAEGDTMPVRRIRPAEDLLLTSIGGPQGCLSSSRSDQSEDRTVQP